MKPVFALVAFFVLAVASIEAQCPCCGPQAPAACAAAGEARQSVRRHPIRRVLTAPVRGLRALRGIH